MGTVWSPTWCFIVDAQGWSGEGPGWQRELQRQKRGLGGPKREQRWSPTVITETKLSWGIQRQHLLLTGTTCSHGISGSHESNGWCRHHRELGPTQHAGRSHQLASHLRYLLPPGSSASPGALGGTLKPAFKEGQRGGKGRPRKVKLVRLSFSF